MAQKRPNRQMRFRVRILILLIVVVGFVLVIGKLFYLQVINSAFYQGKANQNQTKDLIITPQRGTIYDRNMTELVTSATTQEISVDPSVIRENGAKSVEKKYDASGKPRDATDEEVAEALLQYQTKIAEILAKYLDVDEETALERIQKDVSYARIQRQVDADTAKKLLEEISDAGLSGVNSTEDSKRYYSNGQFASQLIGFTNSDGDGLYGVELQYNDVLQGVAGRVVKATNAKGADLPYDNVEYSAPQDGDGVVLSLDEGVQHYLEKHLEEAYWDNDAEEGVCGLVMDVKTGEILAMSTKPDYDLNSPRVIPEEYASLLSELDGLEGEEYDKKYSEILLKLWRNKTINDTYEPGSTFKVFTVSSALESGAVSTSDSFSCPGYKVVDTWQIKCWKSGGHGAETLGETLQNSCNVAMMDISASLGTDLFRKYFEAFGMTESTGIDLPGEATGIFFGDTMGATDLATASFGQNFQVTPLQELCMVTAVVNGGKLITPHVVREIVDSSGNVKQTIDTEVKRQVISEETSAQLSQYLEEVVSEGTGQNAYVAGYRIGGKTATSEKQPRGTDKRIASFIGVAPMDDPQYAVLVMIDEPQGTLRGGGAIAAPVVARIFEDILPYLGVEAVYTEDESAREEVSVPSMVGMSREEAEQALTELGLDYTVVGDEDSVSDQAPEAGIAIQTANTVVLYCGTNRSGDEVEVPSVAGMGVEEARVQLADYGLFMKQNGVADNRISVGTIAMYQNPAAGTKVEPGTVVTVAFGNNVTSEE
ncbi:MAG: penicillin-binding transpeptidase domain-containing protein [Eubacteriales bacterium]|nr:penicillin-binding transpeptidase domain-containing protein [Eubacteriales bacterium]